MTIFTIQKLYTAYKQCIKNKKNTTNALKFELDREQNLLLLLLDLQNRSYKISRHICFVVKNPAPREIFASDFRDRVVQHLLCNEIEQIFEKQFLESSFANRVGKGTHRAFKRVRFFITRGGKNRSRLFFLKMDIKSFFRSIHKETLWNILRAEVEKQEKDSVWKNEVLWLIKTILFHDPASDFVFKGRLSTKKLIPPAKSLFSGDITRGLPIGNITSQFFANVLLHKLDCFIENNLLVKRYVRYVDDFVLFDEDKKKLEYTVGLIENFLEQELLLTVCKDKTFIYPIEHGVDFLGYFIKPTHTLVRRKVVRRFKKIFYSELSKTKDGLLKTRQLARVHSYVGHCVHAHSFRLLKKMKIY